MDQVIAGSDPAGVDLGRLIGRREAFAAVAARCSAADAESLRRIRDEKVYRRLGLTWDEFCVKRLGSSRRNIERTLRWLDEFGPAYFHVAQMAHVSPEEYRAIAPHVSAEGVRVDDAVIALLPENSEQLSAAVAELLGREKPVKEKPVKEKPALSFDAAVKRCEAALEAVKGLTGTLEPIQAMRLTTAVSRLRRAASEKGAQTM
jgi:hypothetical protein